MTTTVARNFWDSMYEEAWKYFRWDEDSNYGVERSGQGSHDGKTWHYSVIYNLESMPRIYQARYEAAKQRFQTLGVSAEGIIFVAVSSPSDWDVCDCYEVTRQATIKVEYLRPGFRTSEFRQLRETEIEVLDQHFHHPWWESSQK